ncbi:unnamed protein product [Schistocephalus solidus]|uniref:LIM zinc-binding domain-containing protein n=1 Tax=Schistocephalus solidus TaxID=70667 RepID=A0A183SDG8_SCHSO|nr:unnamed protein product [Schistocephalus solidus]
MAARYTCCDLELVRPMQVRHLYDNSTTAQMTERSAFSFLRDSLKSSPHLPPASVCIPHSPTSNGARSPCLPTIPTDVSLLKWFQISLSPYISANLCPPIPDLSVTSWRCGRALLCLLHKYTFGVVSLGKLQVIIPEFETDEGVSSQLQEASSLLSEHFSLPLPSDLLVSSPADNCSHLENQSDPAAWPAYLLALCLRLRTLSPSDDYASLFVCKSETTATANSTTPTPIRRPHLSQFNPSRSFDPLSLPRSPHRNRPFNPSVVGSQSTTEVQRLAERLIKRPSSTSADITVSGSAVFRKDPGYRVEKGIISKRRSELISMLNDPASAKRRSMLLEYQSLGCDTASSPLHLRRSASSTHGSQEALNMGLVGSESRSSSAVRKLLINSETTVVHYFAYTGFLLKTSPTLPSVFTWHYPPPVCLLFEMLASSIRKGISCFPCYPLRCTEKPRKSTEFCVVCKKRLYAAEYRAFEGYRVHPSCFRCAQCQRALRPEIAHCYRPSSQPGQDPVFYCTAHFKRQQLENMEFTKCPSKLKPPPSPSVAPLNCASAPVKRRAHNTPSLFYDLVPKPPDLKTPSDFQPTRVSPHQKTRQPIPCDRNVSRISAGKKGHRRRAPMTSTSDQLLLNIPSGYPSLPRMRGIREPQGIRDEPSPPLSICSLPMSDILGMPESARQAAFESRLCESLLGNCALSVPVDSSPPAAADLQDEAYLAATESSSESTDDVNNTSPCGDGHSPVRLERMLSVCRAMRADALYRRSHPLEESSSSSSSSPSPSEPISDADGDVVPRVGPLGISAPIYENARWTLDRSEKLSQKSAAASSSANLLAQKYGLLNPSHIPTTADSNLSTFCSSNSLLAAKERFCMEAPKPVSIDPVAFLSNKNREVSHITYLSDCSECVEPLPGLFSPTCLVSSWVDNDHLHSCLTFQQPSGQHVYPLTYYSSVISRLQNLHTTTLNFLFTTLHWTEKLRTLPPDTWHKANVHTVATPTSPHLYLTEPPLVQQINAAGAFLPLATPGEDIRDIDSHSIMTASPEKVDDYENSLSSSVASSKNISHDEERVEFWPPEVVDQPNTDRETLTVGADSSHRRILAPPLELSELRSEVEQLDYLTRSQTAPEFMKTARKGSVSGGEQSYSMPSRNGISDSSRGKKASDESGIAISNRPVPLFIYTTRFYSDSDTEDLFPCRTEEEDGTDASNATTTSYSDSDSATSTSRLPVAAAVPEAPIVPVNRMCASCSPPLGLHFPSVDINSVPASDMRKQKIEQLKRHLEQLTAQMKALEDKSTTTERELRRVESSAKPNVVDAKNASVALSSSEPDIACLAAKSVTLPKCKHRELPPSLAKRAKFPLRRSRRPLHEEGRSVQAGRPDTLPRACMAFTDCAGTVGPSEMQEVRTCDPVEESYLQIKHSRLFSELLNIIAQRNNLVTQEAELVSQVKQLELELYQDALETAYRTLHSSSPPPPPSAMSSSSSRPPVGNSLRKESRWRVPFRRTHKPTADLVAHKHCQRRAVSLEVGAREISADQCALLPRRQESQQSESLEGQLLLSEIWRVINERTTRSVVRDKTMQW